MAEDSFGLLGIIYADSVEKLAFLLASRAFIVHPGVLFPIESLDDVSSDANDLCSIQRLVVTSYNGLNSKLRTNKSNP